MEDRARDAASVEYGELPELTRGLRTLGSSRRGGSTQMLFFGPLLEARRRAADAKSPQARVRAFNATDLAMALDRAIDRIVSGWPDVRPPARRALRAELTDRVAPYVAALELLARRANDVVDRPDESVAAWRDWTAQLSQVFSAADRCWLNLRAVVESIPPARPDSPSGQHKP